MSSNTQSRSSVSTGVTGWQDGIGVGSGLARPCVEGNILRRRSWSVVVDSTGCSRTIGTGSGNTKISELLPRYLRLSALIAMELGSEARENVGPDPRSPLQVPEGSTREAEERFRLKTYAFKPTDEWYILLVGLITRAALEGYLTGGWRGSNAADCLFAVGMGICGDQEDEVDGQPHPEHSAKDDMEVGDEFEWFDPIALPTLREAAEILFPSIQGGQAGQAEEYFHREMSDRLQKFYSIPLQSPDLAMHMESLACHWPALPIERAAVRFCEAVAKWRGKPELETYKRRHPFSFKNASPPPTQPKSQSSIYRYFSDMPLSTNHKRKRTPD